jgi:hypothetical protein
MLFCMCYLQGVVNMINAAKQSGGVKHVVLVSSMLTDPANRSAQLHRAVAALSQAGTALSEPQKLCRFHTQPTYFSSCRQSMQTAGGQLCGFAVLCFAVLGCRSCAPAQQLHGVLLVADRGGLRAADCCRFYPVRVLLNNIRWSLMDNKFAGEQQLRQSGLPYTIVRPGGLGNGPAGTQQLQAGVPSAALCA